MSDYSWFFLESSSVYLSWLYTKALRLAEGVMLEPSRDEQNLIDFALEEFSASLTQFILAGLGEETTVQRWHFTITFMGESGTLEKRHVHIITHEPADGSSCLPRARDPLVLLALLRLLLHNRKQDNHVLVFQEEEVFKLLGWEDSDEARQEIDEAIYRYSLLMYKWQMNRSELTRRGLSYYTSNAQALSEYRTLDKKPEEGGQTKRVYNSVRFSETLIDGLLGRSLFGVGWNRVTSIKPISGAGVKNR